MLLQENRDETMKEILLTGLVGAICASKGAY